MIKISEKANPNYLGKVIKIKGIKKHPKADRLQIVTVDFQSIITGLDAKEGDIYVYFPIECKINKELLSYTNSFEDTTLNKDSTKKGFFNKTGRVRATRLREVASMGYIIPVALVEEFTKAKFLSEYIGQEFDTIKGIVMLEKYIPELSQIHKNVNKIRQGKSPKINRLKINRMIDGQVHFHVDTKNLRKNVEKLNLEDIVSITYKTHGTSFWVSNVLVKRQLSFLEKIANKVGVKVDNTKYDVVYGSRKIVKNANERENKEGFYGYDLWKDISTQIGENIPKGFTVYGECLGFLPDGRYIQKQYDYGCKTGEYKLEVYRITHTNEDGLVIELSYIEIQEFCDRANLKPSTLFYYGTVKEFLLKEVGEISENSFTWNAQFIDILEKKYNEKECFMCSNKVPEEGVVVRKESLFSCEAFKLKSFKFLEFETKELDTGEIDLESMN